jgi:chromosome segregation ATPase
MEKIKSKMNEETDDLLLDLEKAQAQASNLEKKQKKVDQQIKEWKIKCDELQAELENAQKDVRTHSSEVLKMRKTNEEMEEKVEQFKKENRMLSSEVQTMSEQFSEGGSKNSAEVEKVRRKMGLENEELQAALEEAEGALEQEEAKFLKNFQTLPKFLTQKTYSKCNFQTIQERSLKTKFWRIHR